MTIGRWLVCLVLAWGIVGTAAGAETQFRKSLKLPPDVAVPNDTAVAVYIPARYLDLRFYSKIAGVWVEPGAALNDARNEIGKQLFTHIMPVDFKTDGQYSLLLALNPKWGIDKGVLRLEMRYRVFDGGGKELLSGQETDSGNVNAANLAGAFLAVASKVTKLVYADVLRELKPTAEKFPASSQLAALDSAALIDRSEPATTGTAFYINKQGQLMTAAHVLDDCLAIEARQDARTFPVKRVANSDLLDLAIVDSGAPTEKALSLRKGQEVTLGESVTNVGYPLQGILSASPNLTRGNVSARGGLKGSEGIFQFSAPIQPGSSGGPVVSDKGELLGVTVGTLNASVLIERGLLPQNVNFALDARYAAMFMRQANIEFNEIEPTGSGDMQTANAAALGAVVQLSCYQ
ncbi:MAG TPA: serine protease [Steroidobacteraceae bacterium]|nr:serine protease [Steroidobacteraceae bacterium]